MVIFHKKWQSFRILDKSSALEEECKKLVSKRIRCGWKKFKDITYTLKLRESMYKRSVFCHDAECWALKKEDERELVANY